MLSVEVVGPKCKWNPKLMMKRIEKNSYKKLGEIHGEPSKQRCSGNRKQTESKGVTRGPSEK